MSENFINATAKQLAAAGQYSSAEEAGAALRESLESAREAEKQAFKNMNRKQRRKAGKKMDALLKALELGSKKISEQFNALPEEQQKAALLNILWKVHEENKKCEEQNNGTDEAKDN